MLWRLNSAVLLNGGHLCNIGLKKAIQYKKAIGINVCTINRLLIVTFIHIAILYHCYCEFFCWLLVLPCYIKGNHMNNQYSNIQVKNLITYITCSVNVHKSLYCNISVDLKQCFQSIKLPHVHVCTCVNIEITVNVVRFRDNHSPTTCFPIGWCLQVRVECICVTYLVCVVVRIKNILGCQCLFHIFIALIGSVGSEMITRYMKLLMYWFSIGYFGGV